MRVFVTGGSGYLGQGFIPELIRHGHDAVNVDLLPFPDQALPIQDIRADVRDEAAILRSMQGAEAVVHLAALVPITKAGAAFDDVNIGGTRTVLAAAERLKIKKVIVVSSSAVFGVPTEVPITAATPRRPVEPYGRSKARAEEVCEAFRVRGLNVVIIRPRTIVGPGRLGVFSVLFERIASGRPVYLLGKGTNLFQLVSVRDVSEVCRLALDRADRQTLNVGGRHCGPLREEMEQLIRAVGSNSRILTLPQKPAIAILRLLDWAGVSPFTAWHYLTYGVDFLYDHSATAAIDYTPRDGNADILMQAYAWYVAHRPRVLANRGSPHSRPLGEGVFGLRAWCRRRIERMIDGVTSSRH